jgi:methyl-accepting chemotaxis protein
MAAFEKTTIQMRVFGGFLLCALITVLCATTGILALQKLHSLLKKSTDSTLLVLNEQTEQSSRMAVLRKIVSAIVEDRAIDIASSSTSALANIPARLASVREGWNNEHAIESLSLVEKTLFPAKNRLLQAEMDFSRGQARLGADLKRLQTSVASFANSVKSEMEMDLLISGAEGMKALDSNQVNAAKGMNKLSSLGMEAISIIRGALLVQNDVSRLDNKIKDIRTAKNLRELNFVSLDCSNIQSAIQSGIHSLKESDHRKKLRAAFASLTSTLPVLIETKKQGFEGLEEKGLPEGGASLDELLQTIRETAKAIADGSNSDVEMDSLLAIEECKEVLAKENKSVKEKFDRLTETTGLGLSAVFVSNSLNDLSLRLENEIGKLRYGHSLKAIQYIRMDIDSSLATMKSLIQSIKARDFAESLKASVVSFEQETKKLFEMKVRIIEAETLISALLSVSDKSAEHSGTSIVSSLNELEDDLRLSARTAKETALKSAQEAQSASEMAQRVQVGAGGVAFVLALGVGYLVLLSVINPLALMRQAATEFSKGDFLFQLNFKAHDAIGQMATSLREIARTQQRRSALAESVSEGDLTVDVSILSEKDLLGRSLQKMTSSLNQLVSQTKETADMVKMGADQISDASQTLSHEATGQAASIEEISATLAEVAGKTKTNAEHANQAQQLTSHARELAQEGSDRMKEMVEAMTQINSSSTQICKIIKVIDDIAFQTNLLALNAAVEAARAGVHGKGFAVVAEEVRNLSSRSAKAARETSALIDNSTAKINNGSQIAMNMSSSLQEIVGVVVKTSDLMSEIATACSEQAENMSQINVNISQLEGVTQQNSASSEEMSAAAIELTKMAQNLQSILSNFRLKETPRNDTPSGKAATSNHNPGTSPSRASSKAIQGQKPYRGNTPKGPSRASKK